jgi:hypothetical protein
MLGAKGDIFIEGAFLKNPLLCAVLNQLRDNNNVILSKDSTGTVQGAGYLSDWGNVQCEIECEHSSTTELSNLSGYKKQWREYAESRSTVL